MKSRVFILVMVLMVLGLMGEECAATQTPQVVVVRATPVAEKPPRPLISPEAVKIITGRTPQEPPLPIPIIPVPEAAIGAMKDIAFGLSERGLVVNPVPFNPNRATSYSLPSLGGRSQGLLMMAAPVDVSLEDELGSLSELPGLALGGFHVPQGIEGYALPAGQYVVRVFFQDGQPQAELYDIQLQMVRDTPMVVRQLQARKVGEPEAVITAREICFTQTTLQACLQLPPPLSSEAIDRMRQAVTELSGAGLLKANVDVEGTVPDIEGVVARTICAGAVGQEPGRCQPSVLAAAATEFRIEPVTGDPSIQRKATAGVLVALETIQDEVWSAETGQLALLPPGNYAVDFLETFDGRWLALLTSPHVEVVGTGVAELSSPTDFSDGAVYIDFDDLPNGSHVTDQYADKGVAFPDVQETSHRITQAPPGFSSPNLLYHYRGPDDEKRKLPLTLAFSEPQARVGFYFLPASNTAATLTAFNASGQVVHRLTRTAATREWQFVGVLSRAQDIARVTLDYGDSFTAEAIDDLHFQRDVGGAQFIMIAESQPERTEVLGEPIQGEPPPGPQGQTVIKNLNWDFIINFCLFRWMECPAPTPTPTPRQP